MNKKTLKNSKKKRNISIKNRGGNPYSDSSRSSSGSTSSTMTISPNETPSKKNLVLRLKVPEANEIEDNKITEVNKEEILKNIRDIAMKLQSTIFDKVESNYEYFTIMKYQIFIDEIFSRIVTSNMNKMQMGGENCNGELLLSEKGKLKDDFFLLSMLKNFVEIKHDFKKQSDVKNYMLNYEKEILDASRIIMRYFSDKNKTGVNYNFFNDTLNQYDNGQESIREHLYMKEVINFMDSATQCKVINRLNLTKYISNSGDGGEDYINKKIADGKQNHLFQYSDKDKTKLLYLSSVDNNPIEKIFSEDQVKFAFTDNSISDAVLYPHANNIDVNRETIENLDDDSRLLDFSTMLNEGNINTIPSFMDPANTSKDLFSNQKFISHNKDITNLIRKRVQELQSLKDPYSLPFLKLLIKSINDFFGYYGSSLKIDDKELNEITGINDFEKECALYINTGKKDAKWHSGYLDDVLSKYPIRLGQGDTQPDKKGFVYFNVLNRGVRNEIKLVVQGTTIRTISTFLNNKEVFPVDISRSDENNIKDVEAKINSKAYPDDYSILFEFSKAIYDNIESKRKKEMLTNLISNKLQTDLQLLMIIIVSLKAFGDACQVNYSRRVNDYLKNTIKFPLGAGIRTTDKNVFAESVLHNNPVWFMNNGIKPHVSWIKKIFSEDVIDFDSHKVFLTNCDKGDVKLYYSEIIKNLNRFNNYNTDGLDLSTPQLQEKQRKKRGPIKLSGIQKKQQEPLKDAPMDVETSGDIVSDSDSKIIVEDKNIDLMSAEKLSLLNTLIKNTIKSKLKNQELDILIVPSVINEENVKNALLQANIFTSTINDYMKNVEYKQDNRESQLEELITECNNSAIKIATQIKKIADIPGGFQISETSLLKNIKLIETQPETKKIKQIYDNLRIWVNDNLNNQCNEKMSSIVQKYNANIVTFKSSIVEEFKDNPKQAERSRRTSTLGKKTYTPSSESSKILGQWSVSNHANKVHFDTYIINRWNNLINIMLEQEDIKENIKEKTKEFTDDLDSSLKTSFETDFNLSEKIKRIHTNLQNLSKYEGFQDDLVDIDIINNINSTTKENSEILTLLKNSFSKNATEITKIMKGGDENTKDFIENFYYIIPEYEKAIKRKTFDIIFKSFKNIEVYEAKKSEIVFKTPEEVSKFIQEKKENVKTLNDTILSDDKMELQTPLSSPMELPLDMELQEEEEEEQEQETMEIQKPIKRVRAKMSSQTSPPEAAVRKPKRKGENTTISKYEEPLSKMKTRSQSQINRNNSGGTKKYKKISIKRNNKIKKQKTKKNRKHRNKRKKK